MNNMEFGILENLKECSDSILIESDTCIAYYIKNDYMIKLSVRGDVEVWYNENVYTNCGDFPKELIELIKNGNNSMYGVYEEMQIEMNNWFNIELYKKEQDLWIFMEDTCECEQNYSNYTEEKMLKELKEYYEMFVEGK